MLLLWESTQSQSQIQRIGDCLMRKYCCPQVHIVERDNNPNREIFCKQCNKWIWKGELYVFQWNREMQRYYLARSPVSDIKRRNIAKAKAVERSRRYRLRQKQLKALAELSNAVKIMEVPILAT